MKAWASVRGMLPEIDSLAQWARARIRVVILALLLGVLVWSSSGSLAVASEAVTGAAIPEPGYILYGKVFNNDGGQQVRLTSGTLTWTVSATDRQESITLTATLTNINDQFSYVLEVPLETREVGSHQLAATPGTLPILADAANYDRTNVQLDGQAATIISPATGTFSLSKLDRGRQERVDLLVNIGFTDTDEDGLPDNWELLHFGNLLQTRFTDKDEDGLNDYGEYVAGTDPNDPESRFAFIDIAPQSNNQIQIRWASQAGKTYTLERSMNLLFGFSPIEAGIPATEGTNTFIDMPAMPATTFFYRLSVDVASRP